MSEMGFLKKGLLWADSRHDQKKWKIKAVLCREIIIKNETAFPEHYVMMILLKENRRKSLTPLML